MSLPDTQAAAPKPDALVTQRKMLESKIRTGSGWLWSVAGFSVVNAFLLRLGCEFGFCVGLFITQVNDYAATKYAREAGANANSGFLVASYIFDALMIGGFALAARMCDRQRRWLLLAGLVVYALDTAFLAWATIDLSLLIHGFTLWYGFQAFRAIGELKRLPLPDPAKAAALPVTVPAAPLAPPLAAQRPRPLAAPRVAPAIAQAEKKIAAEEGLGPELGERREGRGVFLRVHGIQALIVMLTVLGAVILLLVYGGRLLDGDGPVR